ncbi:MAG: tetratricopeptide repeat protein [Pseudomonadota bacterium]
MQKWGLGALMLALAVPAAASDRVVQQPKQLKSDGPTSGGETDRRANDGAKGRGGSSRRSDTVDTAPPAMSATSPQPKSGNPFGRPGRAFDAKFDEGMAAIRARNPGRAVELMRPLLADFEKQYAGEKRQIFCAVTPEQSSRYLADAAKSQREAVAIEPAWCRAQYVRAYALIDLEQYADARVAFEKLISFAPQNSRYLNELGYIFSQQKNWKEALSAYRRAEASADLTPDKTKDERCLALKGMGYALIELGDLNGAEVAYKGCLKLDPDDETSISELNYIEEERKQTV